MARMLGVCRRDWCPYCRGPAGPDCARVSRSKRSARARAKRAWLRQAGQDAGRDLSYRTGWQSGVGWSTAKCRRAPTARA